MASPMYSGSRTLVSERQAAYSGVVKILVRSRGRLLLPCAHLHDGRAPAPARTGHCAAAATLPISAQQFRHRARFGSKYSPPTMQAEGRRRTARTPL